MEAQNAELILEPDHVIGEASTGPDGIRRYWDRNFTLVATKQAANLTDHQVEQLDLRTWSRIAGVWS